MSTAPTPANDPIAAHAAARPEAVAVVVDGAGGATPSVTTWRALDEQVNRLAHALGDLAAPGERIVWCGPNSLEVLVTLHAARKAQLVAVPLSYRFNRDEMAYVIADSGATVVVVDAEQASDVDAVLGRCPEVRRAVAFGGAVPAGWDAWDDVLAGRPTDDPPRATGASAGAAMIYTSGTTGRPKGALRTHSDAGVITAMLERLRLLHPDPVHLTTGPLYHSGPLAFALLAHTLGATVVVLRRFDAEAWIRLVGDHRVTSTFTAPTQLKRIVRLPDDVLADADLSTMRTLIANAAPVPYALKEEVVAKLGDGFLFEVYGSTELGVDCILEPEDQLRKPGSCGRPYGGIEVRVVADDGTEVPTGERGELYVRSPLAMDGYHRSDEQLATLEGGGWKSVGDVAYLDDEGFVYICDRRKDMIISGGVNIYPAEIESVLHEHPDVLDAAVFGIPDDEWGERVHCVVQPRAGTELDLDGLAAFVEARVARYMRPRSYEVRDALPRTESGKLLKRVLREEHWQGRDRAI